MADVFLSYARTERDRAEPVRAALAALGLDVFFDVDGLDGGDVFPDVLDREVKTAGAVVSVWSPHALTRPWIKIESRIGKDRGVLIPVEIATLDSLHDVPAAFYDDQRIDLVDFNGDTSSPGWLKLVKSLARTLERPDLLEQEARSHSHSSAEAADLRAELDALRAQMGDLAAAKAEAASEDRARKDAFALIDDSRRMADYQRFLERFPGGAEAFEAERRLDALESWSTVDHGDAGAIDDWFVQHRASVFPALAAEARRVQKQARKTKGGSKAGLFIGGGLVAAAVALGVFAWVDPLDLIPDAPVPVTPADVEPATDTALGSGDLYDAVEAGDTLPLDVVSGESTGPASTAPNLSESDDAASTTTIPTRDDFGDGEDDSFLGCGDCPEMVVIPAGSFSMGSPSGEAGQDDDEGPQRTVRIGYEFAVGKYEVTWAEWEACVADGGCSNSGPDSAGGDEGWGKGSRPVINVSWEDAQAYVQWLSRRTGERYRLLSEAEWEYVARAGTTSTYFWGNDANRGCSHMNGADATAKRENSGWTTVTCDDGYLNTAPVGSFRANAFGLYDMTGNVWEWVEDCYKDSYSGAPTDGSARIVSDCSRRVLRGGSWVDAPQGLRSAYRGRYVPQDRYDDIGFRVARTL